MKNFASILSFLLSLYPFLTFAQVTTQPAPLQESSQNVTIFFHADQGDKGLMGVSATTNLFAHTWAVLSNNQQVGAPDWNSTYPDKFKLVYVSENLWQLYIGDIREFYGVTNPNVTVEKLGFVFRNANASKTGRAVGGADIMVDVYDEGLQIVLEANVSGYLISPSNGDITFTVGTTETADITLSVNGQTVSTATGTSLTADYDFATPGNYEVTAVAVTDSDSVAVSKNYCYVQDSSEKPYPGGTPKMGPVKNADGSVTFCFGAPEKSSVMIVGAWNDYMLDNNQVMYYTDVNGLRYFWTTVSGLENDQMYGYYFIVDGEIMVGDPYARLVLDPWNDKYLSTDVFPGLPAYPFDKITGVPLAIYQGNINDYDWVVDDFVGVPASDLIVYELLFRDFTGTEGRSNGNGTVRQAIEKFPYLLTLGINAIELLPIMEFNGNNSWGYNPNFYFAPDKAYGTPDDYKEFIDLCHQNGIAVILDMVFNQSDGLHPWYAMYLPGQNPFYNLDAPHAYSVLNDWNQGFPMVQEQWDDVIEYWLTEYKFDGYRFDLVKGLGDNDSYANNGDAATNAYNQSRIDRMIRFKQIVDSINPNAYFINEDLATAKEENAMAEYGELNWANVNDAACQFAMGYQSNSNMNRLYAPKDGSRLWGSTVSYLESHDEERLAYKQEKYGAESIKSDVVLAMQRLGSAAAQMIMTPGAHMIWQFSEMGNAQSTKSSDGGNDTSPKKVNWNLLNEPNHQGLYQNYCELISIRNKNREMFAESVDFSINCGQTNWSAGRTIVSKTAGSELYTVINPNLTGSLTVAVQFEQNSNDAYQIMSKSYSSQPSFDAAAKTVTVPANCYVVVGSKDLDDIRGITSSDTAFRAYGAAGSIIFENASLPVRVFTADGKLVRVSDGEDVMGISSGLYFVKCGEATAKVIVK